MTLPCNNSLTLRSHHTVVFKFGKTANSIFEEIVVADPTQLGFILLPWLSILNSLSIEERFMAFATIETTIDKHVPNFIKDIESRFNFLDTLCRIIHIALDRIALLTPPPTNDTISVNNPMPSTTPIDITSETPPIVDEAQCLVTLVRTIDKLLHEHGWVVAMEQSAVHLTAITRLTKLQQIIHADTTNFRTAPHLFRQPSHPITSDVDQLTTSHETALVSVLRTIRGNLPPPEYALPAAAPASMAFDVRIRELKWDELLGSALAEARMATMRRDIDMWREWCVENVRLRGRAWSSLLKVMVQFVDLFISDLAIGDAANNIAALIVSEGLVKDFVESIQRLSSLFVRTRAIIEADVIKASSLLLKVYSFLPTPEDRFLFPEYLYNTRPPTQSIHQPTFESWTFWPANFHTQITMACNQLVVVAPAERDSLVDAKDEVGEEGRARAEEVFMDEGDGGGAAVERLQELSLISPYYVLRALCFEAIRNKGQSVMIARLLQRYMGQLTWLRGGNGVSLLVMVVRDVLLEMQDGTAVPEILDVEKVMEVGGKKNFVEFVVRCMGLIETTKITPLQLSIYDTGEWAYRQITTSDSSPLTPRLLEIREYLIYCVIPFLRYPVETSPSSSLIPLAISLSVLRQLFVTLPPQSATPLSFSTKVDTLAPRLSATSHDSWLYRSRPFSLVHLLSVLLDHRRKEDGRHRMIGMMQWEDVVFVAGRVIKEVELYVGMLGENDGASDDDTTKKLLGDVTKKLYKRSKSLDWTVQLLLLPLLRKCGHQFGFPVDAISVPAPLVTLCGSMNGTIISSELGGRHSVKSLDAMWTIQQWISFAEACRVSDEWMKKLYEVRADPVTPREMVVFMCVYVCVCTLSSIISDLFEALFQQAFIASHATTESGIQSILPLAFYHVLHPSSSLSVGEEYERLLVGLVSWLIDQDMLPPQDLLKVIDGGGVSKENESEEELVREMGPDEVKSAAVIALSMRLLAVSARFSSFTAKPVLTTQSNDARRFTASDGEESYFVSNIIKALKTLQPWGQRFSTSNPLSENPLSPSFLVVILYFLCQGTTHIRSEKATESLFLLILQTVTILTSGTIVTVDGAAQKIGGSAKTLDKAETAKKKKNNTTEAKRKSHVSEKDGTEAKSNVVGRDVDVRNGKGRLPLTERQNYVLREAVGLLRDPQHRITTARAVGLEDSLASSI
ncbi:hypothetical protein BC937DRAFT_88358 [Endogone sp. FLAS-F59071]|nr:hypothetical protein BC937DRAFT_88358 [Endogone sp. FLAS-F59071]|eukprot:RUS22597.1 hypothetical protein BC937DRAFT_88358 [Endogone sp. FLAS-F59071]